MRFRQINEALGYDRSMNAMVWDIERKRVAQNPDPADMPSSQICAAAVQTADKGADQLKMLLGKK